MAIVSATRLHHLVHWREAGYAAVKGKIGRSMPQYWYNVVTHEVEEDAQSDWTQLIGPYDSRAEAEAAPQKVKERNEAWDKDDDQ